MFWIISISGVIILIGMNAIYVAAEFSTVSARRARLAQMAETGDQVAAHLLYIVENSQRLDAYVATCQVGITISSLVLGYFGQARFSSIINPLFEQIGYGPLAAEAVSATAILIVLSIFQVVIGELIPKNLGIQYPEKIAHYTAPMMRVSEWFFAPLIWFFNGSGILLMRIMGIEPSKEHGHIHSPEEIALLVEESGEGGAINPEEHRLLRNTLQMRETMIKQLMIPRPRMLSAPEHFKASQLLELLADSPYSRIPIYSETIDNILGVVHLRDLICADGPVGNKEAKDLLHSVPFVPESMETKNVFSLLQNQSFQVAIVLDEYGGTAGMVTLEDLLEQIFGELQDEFDLDPFTFRIMENNQIWVRGDMPIKDLNQILELSFSQKNAETIGGLAMNTIGHVPIIKEELKIGNINFRVEKMTGRGVALLSFIASDEQLEKIRANQNYHE